MGYSIKPLIIKQLKDVFKCKVYDEQIRQGLSTPCFILDVKPVNRKRLANQNDKQVFVVLLHYYTEKTENLYEQFENIAEKFMSPDFRYLGDKYHIDNLEVEYNENDLICTFKVTRYIRWTKEEIKMQVLERIGETSHDGTI